MDSFGSFGSFGAGSLLVALLVGVVGSAVGSVVGLVFGDRADLGRERGVGWAPWEEGSRASLEDGASAA